MRILITTDTAGGVWTYSIELARGLEAAGVDVVLAAMGPEPTPEQHRARPALVHRPYALEWMPDPWDEVDTAGEWLLEVAGETRPDIVHLNGYAHAALPWEVPVLVAGHSCVLSWFEATRGTAAPAEYETYRERVEAGLASADLLVAPTRAMLDALLHLYAPQCETLVIPNARSAEGLEPLPKEPLVVTAGRRWDEAKNVAAVERVAAELPWRVEVVGPQTANEPPVFAPLARAVRRASVFALPARYEPFGLTPLEAALAGCALVLGDIGSLREVWGDAALFVPPDDDAALEGAVLRLIECDGLRRDLAARGRRRALEYSPERMTRAYLTAYDRLRVREPV